MNPVLMVVVGLYGFSAALVGSLLAIDKFNAGRAQAQVGDQRPVPHDAYPFGSLAEQVALYGHFWEIVGPSRTTNAPVVPEDGGAPRWTP